MPSAHVVVGAVDDGCSVRTFKTHRTVLRIVGDVPNPRLGLDARLVPVRIIGRDKSLFFPVPLPDGDVLVEWVRRVGGGFFGVFLCGFAVSDVVVAVAVCLAVHRCSRQFASAVVGKAVVDGTALSGGLSLMGLPRLS